METRPNKELYEAPATRVLELKGEGIVCMSPGEYPSWGESPATPTP